MTSLHPGPAGLPTFPRLVPEVALAWRDVSTLQVGIDQRLARILPRVTQREYRALRALDGTRSLTRTLDDFEATGGDRGWLISALHALVATGAIVDAATERALDLSGAEAARLSPDTAVIAATRPGEAHEVLRRRRDALVQVRGTGRVGVGVATLLTAAGVGRLRITPIAGDAPRVLPRSIAPLGPPASALGQPARTAARAAASRAALTDSTGRPAEGSVTALIVVCPPRVVAPELAEQLAASGRPHLVVMSDGPLARVGPLVVPGSTPCLRCLELHRRDRDPTWPLVLTQVAHQRGPHRSATDGVLATLAASVAALHALALIDDPTGPAPPSAGGMVELRIPELQWRRRAWGEHPECGCTWAPDQTPRAA